MSANSGKIITFYSYKGGTGRTMALSNVAWVLASNGYKVLLIDWDLEAPGLHRYLRPFLVDPELSNSPGLIDFVWDSAEVNMTPMAPDDASHVTMKFPSLEDYVVGLDFNFHGRGSIAFIPAGRQDENYAQRVNTFNWDNFYERLGGGKLLEAERAALRARYDYILIDSRTGVSDTSGICTVQMPDALVVFFTLNRQSMDGTAAVATSITAATKALRGEAIPIYPAPTRIENGEQDKLAAAIGYARRVFAPFLLHVQFNPSDVIREQQAKYWNDVETPYVTFYAFEEVPAAFKDESGSRRGLLAPNERLAFWLSDQSVSAMRPPSDEVRESIVDAYGFDAESGAIDGKRFRAHPRGFFGSFISDIVAITRLQLKRRQPWQLSTIVLACITVFTIAMWGSQKADWQRQTADWRSQTREAQSEITKASGQIAQQSQGLQTAINNLPSQPRSVKPNLEAIKQNLDNIRKKLDGLKLPI